MKKEKREKGNKVIGSKQGFHGDSNVNSDDLGSIYRHVRKKMMTWE